MVVDSTLTFAARRAIPIRYDRNLVSTTLKAMQRVSEIRAKRERVFYKSRMAGNKERKRLANAKVVAEGEHLLPRVRASKKIAVDVEKQPLEEERLEMPVVRQKAKGKKRQRLLVGGGVEDVMDVD